MNNSNNNLQQAVQSTITTFLENRITSNSDIAVDVYRAIRNEAQLLLERQLIFDTFDADPFELMKVSTAEDDGSTSSDEDLNEDEVASDNRGEENNNDDIQEKRKNTQVIKRIKNILNVISCTRTATLDGYVRVHAVVELRNDGRMDKCVNENIRLHFTFLREPQHDDIANESSVDENAVESSREEERDSNAKQSSERNNDNTNSDTEQPAKKKCKGMNKHDDVSPIDSKDETVDDIIHTQQGNNCNSQGLTPKTIITYKIDYSIDYGKMEQLLGVDIYALGEHPSVETAVQMFDDDDDNGNEDVNDDMEEGTDQHLMTDDEEARNNSCGGCCDTKGACNKMKDNNVKQKQSTNNKSEFEDIEMSDDDDNSNCCNKDDIEDNDGNNRADRFGVYINPENVVSFLNRANINFNEQAVFYFLLTFPFYEHEWEIAGFLLSALGEDEEEDYGLEEGDENDDCGISNGCEIGCSGGKSCCS